MHGVSLTIDLIPLGKRTFTLLIQFLEFLPTLHSRLLYQNRPRRQWIKIFRPLCGEADRAPVTLTSVKVGLPQIYISQAGMPKIGVGQVGSVQVSMPKMGVTQIGVLRSVLVRSARISSAPLKLAPFRLAL